MTAVIALAVMFAVGLLPTVAAVGLRPEAVPAAVLVGAAMATAAGTVVVIIGGDLRLLTVVIAVVANAVAALRLRSRWPLPLQFGPFLWLIGPAVALTWTLQALRRFEIGWDGRSIWLLHARLLFGGHDSVIAGAKAAGFSHVEYPVLTSAPVAVTWQFVDRIDYRTGQLVIAGLTAAAATLVGLCAARAVGGANAAGRARVAGVLVAGVLVAGVLTAVLYGSFAGIASNGYADPLCASLTAAALGYGLLVPPQRWSHSLALILLGLASVSKTEGFVYAVIGLVAMAVLRPTVDRGTRLPPVAFPIALVTVAVWPVTVRVLGFGSYLTNGNPLHGAAAEPLHRLGELVGPAWSQLTLGPAALLAAVVLLETARSPAARRGVTLFVLAGLGCLVALTLVYVLGPIEIHFWIQTSLTRTTMTIKSLCLLLITVAGGTGLREIAAGRGRATSSYRFSAPRTAPGPG